LQPSECKMILTRIKTRLGCEDGIGPLEVLKLIRSQTILIDGIDAELEFDLTSTLSAAGIQPSEKVLINWFRFDEIDEMSVEDLSKYFDDIWYPAADAIEIFDRSITWILSVGYSGEVSLLKLPFRP
jgi:hypothetical protein